MKRTRIIFAIGLIFSAIIYFSCIADDAKSVTAPGTSLKGVETLCDDWAVITDGIYKYENNTWGVNDSITYQQCLITNKKTKKRGWTWTFSGKAPNWVYSYPEIIVGWKPWGQSVSTHKDYPVKLSDIKKLEIRYDVDLTATGSYNLAPEIWLIRDKPASIPMQKPETLISTEIMFWMDYSSDARPAGSKVGSFKFDGKEYDLWVKAGHNNSGDTVSWQIYSLVSKEKQLKGTIDVIGLIEALRKEGHKIDMSEYVSSVEFGNETIGPKVTSKATGTTWINNYEVELIKK
ncbi:MAG: hypothetical protein PF637_12420 [Spirochaetes bacterium]|jgi:hypothetical protein|nr:hypothetical protein [Spirochaetota bacterium]